MPDLRRYRDSGLAYAMSPDDSARRFPGSNHDDESLCDFRYGEIAFVGRNAAERSSGMAAVTNLPSLSQPAGSASLSRLGSSAYAMSPDDSARRFPGSSDHDESLGDFRYGETAFVGRNAAERSSGMAAVTNLPSLSQPAGSASLSRLGSSAYAMSPDDSARRFPGSSDHDESLCDFRYGEIAFVGRNAAERSSGMAAVTNLPSLSQPAGSASLSRLGSGLRNVARRLRSSVSRFQ